MTTGIINPTSLVAKQVARGTTPKPSAILPIVLDFTTNDVIQASIPIIEGIRNVHGLAGIQSIFIDNSNNGDNLNIAFDNGYTVVCPAFCQAIFPVFFSGQLLNFIATSEGGVVCTAIFLNTREQAQIWTAKIPVEGVVNVTGSTIFTQPLSSTFTDASGILAAAGVSQQLVPADGARQMIQIRNPALAASQGIAAPEPVYLNFGGAAVVNGASSWELLPGEQLPQMLIQSTQQINWTATTVGHILIAKFM
jgi:hypothetical protein